MTECYYVTSQSVVVPQNLGPIESTKYMVGQKGDLPVYEVTPEGQKKANQEYSIEISCCLLISCKVICQNLAHDVPERGEGHLVLTKEASFISMVVTVGVRGSYLASHPPSWKCCQRQQQKQTTINKRIWMAPKKICCLTIWRMYQNMVRTR